MSRPIKFRAWGKNIKEYLSADGKEPQALTLDDISGGCIYDIDLFDIEQYTGLKDKNGKEIYEGDIVNISGIACTDDSSMACIIDTNSVVIWDEKYARFDVNDVPEDDDLDYRRRRYFLFTDGERDSVEVIGNIHENKELLGVKE